MGVSVVGGSSSGLGGSSSLGSDVVGVIVLVSEVGVLGEGVVGVSVEDEEDEEDEEDDEDEEGGDSGSAGTIGVVYPGYVVLGPNIESRYEGVLLDGKISPVLALNNGVLKALDEEGVSVVVVVVGVVVVVVGVLVVVVGVLVVVVDVVLVDDNPYK